MRMALECGDACEPHNPREGLYNDLSGVKWHEVSNARGVVWGSRPAGNVSHHVGQAVGGRLNISKDTEQAGWRAERFATRYTHTWT